VFWCLRSRAKRSQAVSISSASHRHPQAAAAHGFQVPCWEPSGVSAYRKARFNCEAPTVVLGGESCLYVCVWGLADDTAFLPLYAYTTFVQLKDRLDNKKSMGTGFCAPEWNALWQAIERVLVSLLCSL
jgi:hypothetical protein